MHIRKDILLLISLLTFVFIACSERSAITQLPDQLAGLHLVRVGEEDVAKNKLSQMHHGVDFAEYESVVGTYRDNEDEATVYMTIFDSADKSAAMMSRMVENLKRQESQAFSYLEQFAREGKTIHAAGSAGQTHYFFHEGKKNMWISAPPTLVELVLNDFLAKSK